MLPNISALKREPPLDAATRAAILEQRFNAIINGDFEVWQRGTSFVGAGSGTFSADRFSVGNPSAAVFDITRITDVPTVAQIGRLLNYAVMIDCTTADAAVAAGDVANLVTKVEGGVFRLLAQQPLVLRFGHKHTKVGEYSIALQNSGADRSFVAPYYQKVSDAWEVETIFIPPSPSGGTWNYATGVGAQLTWALMTGTTYQATPGVWQTGNFLGTPNQVNALDSTANNFRIAGVELFPADQLYLPSMPRPFQEELALCQRYYEKTFAYDTAPAQNAGLDIGESATLQIAGASTTTAWNNDIKFTTPKRAAPTVTLYNPSAANAQARNRSGAVDCSATTASGITDRGFQITYTSSAGSSANVRNCVHWTASAEL